jgi:hypothetical protein
LIASSLANGISQGKEKDFLIIWEVFLGDGKGDLVEQEIQLTDQDHETRF